MAAHVLYCVSALPMGLIAQLVSRGVSNSPGTMYAVSNRVFVHIMFFSLCLPVACMLTNRTIDDEYGDSVTGAKPVYQPAWNYGPSCTSCAAHPNQSLLFDQTWHEITDFPDEEPSPVNITLTFTGIAVTIYCMVPNSNITYASIAFELDGQIGPPYTYTSVPGISFYKYNVSVYSASDLEAKEHTLVISPQPYDYSYMAFDWAEYTYDEEVVTTPAITKSSSTTATEVAPLPQSGSPTVVPLRHTDVGAIAGGVVGGIAGLALGLLLFMWHRRHRGADSRDTVLDMTSGTSFHEPQPTIEPYVGIPRMSQLALSASHASFERLPTKPSASTLRELANSGSSHQMGTSLSTIYTTVSPTTLSGPISPGETQTSKFTSKREELVHHLDEMEQYVEHLRRQAYPGGGDTSAPAPTVPAQLMSAQRGDGIFDDTDIRRQIEDLQMEVERLKANSAAADEAAPPAYEQDETM